MTCDGDCGGDPARGTCRRLWRALAAAYPIDRRGASWGHVDLDPSRKSDPGPLWSRTHLPTILDAVYGPVP